MRYCIDECLFTLVRANAATQFVIDQTNMFCNFNSINIFLPDSFSTINEKLSVMYLCSAIIGLVMCAGEVFV